MYVHMNMTRFYMQNYVILFHRINYKIRRAIFIKLENLKIGMILKNYKELCRILEEEVKTGGAKKNQLEWFEDYFTYEKQGHKFKITDVFYDKEIKPMPTRGGANNTYEYTQNIEKLLLDILAQDKNEGKIFLSKNKMFHLLDMVNTNYIDCNRKIPKLSKFLDIDERNVQEWYDTTGGMLERSLESALKKLQNQSLVFWSREITICKLKVIKGSGYWVKIIHKDENGEDKEQWTYESMTKKIIEEASDDEKKYIIAVEREEMEKLDCDDKQEIIRKGLWEKFEDNVTSILKKYKGIIYYYKSYKILFNPEHIIKKQNQMNKLLLNLNERQNQKYQLNNSIIQRNIDNALSRQSIAKSSDIQDKDLSYNDYKEMDQIDKQLRRSSDTYIDNNIKLNETLIDKKAKDIRTQVNKTKIN